MRYNAIRLKHRIIKILSATRLLDKSNYIEEINKINTEVVNGFEDLYKISLLLIKLNDLILRYDNFNKFSIEDKFLVSLIFDPDIFFEHFELLTGKKYSLNEEHLYYDLAYNFSEISNTIQSLPDDKKNQLTEIFNYDNAQFDEEILSTITELRKYEQWFKYHETELNKSMQLFQYYESIPKIWTDNLNKSSDIPMGQFEFLPFSDHAFAYTTGLSACVGIVFINHHQFGLIHCDEIDTLEEVIDEQKLDLATYRLIGGSLASIGEYLDFVMSNYKNIENISLCHYINKGDVINCAAYIEKNNVVQTGFLLKESMKSDYKILAQNFQLEKQPKKKKFKMDSMEQESSEDEKTYKPT